MPHWEVTQNSRIASTALIKEQSDIEIVIKDYAGSVERMNADMIAGNLPDIYDLQGLSVVQYVNNSYLEAMQTAGGFYYVADGFDVISLVANTADVGTDSGWSYAEMENDAACFYIMRAWGLVLKIQEKKIDRHLHE